MTMNLLTIQIATTTLLRRSAPTLLLFLLLGGLTSCGKDSTTNRTALMKSFEQIADPETGMLNEEAAQNYLAAAETFAQEFPTDTAAALPLYRAAEVARALGKPAKAIEIYQQIITQYPTFSKAAEAHFMLAFSYDEDMNNLESARKEYEAFIKTYPSHGFVDDAEMLLSNLGKSDEEILRELEAKLAQPQE